MYKKVPFIKILFPNKSRNLFPNQTMNLILLLLWTVAARQAGQFLVLLN